MNPQRHPSSNKQTQGRPIKKPHKLYVTVEQGKTAFRLLCPTAMVGGLIGPSGSIIQRIELQSSSKIKIEDLLVPGSPERQVYVIGADTVDRTTSFRRVVGGGEFGEEDDIVFDVSSAQMGLLMVYERILEVDCEAELGSDGAGGDGDGDRRCIMRCCRLLAARDQAGALIGREGKNVEMIRKQSGSHIRVLAAEQLPPCADLADELIQITGDSIAIRKALLLVSKCLQENQPKEKQPPILPSPTQSLAHVSSSHGPYRIPDLHSYPNNINGPSFAPSTPCVSGSIIVEVVYKILCPTNIIGLLIGKGGITVKALEDETGASVHFASQVAGCHERAITISAMEEVESDYSPTQNGVIRIFERATEALTKTGMVPLWNIKQHVSARLLTAPNQVGCLIGVRGTILSDIKRLTNTMIQVLDKDRVPPCASIDDKVVQITGEYANVRNAIVEVTRRLRERIFLSKGIKVDHAKSYAPYPILDETQTLEHKMEDLNLSEGPHQVDIASEESVVTSVTVGISEDVFNIILGEGSGTLAKIIEISGAEVELQPPIDGNEAKVIISGPPNQTLAGQSLLRVYTISAT